MFDAIGLVGVLRGLCGWPFAAGACCCLPTAAALLAAAFAGEPPPAHWTQTFIGSAAHFLAQFFPPFLLGALFGNLMEDGGSVATIVCWMTKRLGADRAMLAVARPALRS
jgi:H+/gluconate symporter-like permease